MAGYYRIIVLLLVAGLAIAWIESLASRTQLASHRVLGWEVLRLVRGRHEGARGNWALDRMLGYPGFLVVLILHGLALGALALSSTLGELSAWAAAGVVATLLVMNYRNAYSLEGADQMLSLVAVTVLLYTLAPESRLVASAGLWFIALQAVLAYFAAGVAKLLSPAWRSGDALRRVMNTETYGRESLARALHERPGLAQAMSWQVIVFQILFPIALVSGPVVCMVLLAWGATFHLVSAFVMGLHRFVWAFLATYPAIWWCMSAL